jgi:spermidine synthase
LTPFLLNNLDYLYKFIYRTYEPSSSVILLLQIILSVVVLLIPTILMGFTLPILTSWIASKKEYLSSVVGIIYSFNTFGALFGAFISGFYLIRLTGVYQTLYIAVLCNFLIGIVALLFSPKAGHETYEEPRLEPNKDTPIRYNPQIIFVSVGIFICGFVGLGYEILWIRTILHILSSEIYVFSAILSIYLVGYALGVYLGSALIKKTTNYFFITGIIIQLIGIYGVIYIPFLNMVVFNPAPWFKDLIVFTVTKYGPFIHLLYGFPLFFIPSVLMGMSFPLLIQLFIKSDKRAGNIVATAYSINTFGNVLGSILVAFLFIPLLGSQLAKQILGLTSILTGLLFMFYTNKLYAKIIPVSILLASLIITFAIPKNAYLKYINRCEGKGRPVLLLDSQK